MWFIIILFFIAILTAFLMLSFRAWELRTSRIEKPEVSRKLIPEIYFRQIEKIALYLTKHAVHWIVLSVVKYYLIFTTKAKKWMRKNYPKITNFFKKRNADKVNTKTSFLQRAIVELGIKIRRMKEKIKRDHEN